MAYKAAIFTFLVPILGLLPLGECLAQGHEAESRKYEQRLEKGIDAFYRSDWEEAGRIFVSLQKQDPNDSRPYFFHSMIPFWKYYFGESSRETAEVFLSRSKEAIEVSQNQLDVNPRDTTMVLMLSGLHGYRSLVAASEKEYQTAVKSGMTGFKYTRQLLSLDADDPKALIGKGIFYYMVGSVPNGLQWVTNMIGVSGDMQEGFRALEKAANSESYVSNDAKMILTYLYERENQPEKALPYIRDLTNRYPSNIIFQYNLARILEQCGHSDKARQRYERILAMDTVELQSLKDKSQKRLRNL